MNIQKATVQTIQQTTQQAIQQTARQPSGLSAQAILLCTALMVLMMVLTLPVMAWADTLPSATFKSMIAHADDYGFSHYTEVEVEDDGAIEVEGWISEEWRAKVDFAADGTPVREERQQKNDGPGGMTSDQIHAAIDTATNQGMTQIEKIEIDRLNIIEVEGKNDRRQELEIHINADTGEVTGVKRD